MSVGINLYYGDSVNGVPTQTPAGGLGKIINDNPGAGVTFGGTRWLTNNATLAAIPAGRFAESFFSYLDPAAANSHPLDKISSFQSVLGADFGGGLDYAGMKFCFTDVDTSQADTEATWNAYYPVMDAIEAAHPGRLVFFTVPLTHDTGTNAWREWFSNQVRTRYGATGRVFDIARWESHQADGTTPCTGANSVPILCAAYDTGDGHLVDTAATYIAQRYLDFLYVVDTAP
jgi:hypothetical protein